MSVVVISVNKVMRRDGKYEGLASLEPGHLTGKIIIFQ